VRHRRVRRQEARSTGLIEGLRKLEYRGYDPPDRRGGQWRWPANPPAEGKLRNLEEVSAPSLLDGTYGDRSHPVGLRTAAPARENAHWPHLAMYRAYRRRPQRHRENYLSSEKKLGAGRPHVFTTGTDTEIIASLW